MDPIATRPQNKREALDQSLAEAVAHVRNDAAPAAVAFEAMRDTIVNAPDVEVAAFLAKKLVATALSSWTPPTSDPDAFVAAAKLAGFDVVVYGAGKHPGPAVVREPGYSTTTGPLLRSIARAFATDVLAPVIKSWREKAPDNAFFQNLAELARAGSLEAPSSPKLPSVARFAVLLALIAMACAKPAQPPPPPPTTTKPADVAIGPQPKTPKIDATAALAILSAYAPSAQSSVRNEGDGVVIDLAGAGSPDIAFQMLSSLEPNFMHLSVTALSIEPNAWKASLTNGSTAAPQVTFVVAVAKPIFGGQQPLLATGTMINATVPAGIAFSGTLAPGRGRADLAYAKTPGYEIARVDSGPPFVIELAPVGVTLQ